MAISVVIVVLMICSCVTAHIRTEPPLRMPKRIHLDQCEVVVRSDCVNDSLPYGKIICVELTDKVLFQKLKDIGGYNPNFVAMNSTEAAKFKDPRLFNTLRQTRKELPTRAPGCNKTPTTRRPTTRRPTTRRSSTRYKRTTRRPSTRYKRTTRRPSTRPPWTTRRPATRPKRTTRRPWQRRRPSRPSRGRRPTSRRHRRRSPKVKPSDQFGGTIFDSSVKHAKRQGLRRGEKVLRPRKRSVGDIMFDSSVKHAKEQGLRRDEKVQRRRKRSVGDIMFDSSVKHAKEQGLRRGEKVLRRRKRSVGQNLSCWSRGSLVNVTLNGDIINTGRYHLCGECHVVTHLDDDKFPRYINEAVCKYEVQPDENHSQVDQKCAWRSGLCKQRILTFPAIKMTGQFQQQNGPNGQVIYVEITSEVTQVVRASCQCQIDGAPAALLKKFELDQLG